MDLTGEDIFDLAFMTAADVFVVGRRRQLPRLPGITPTRSHFAKINWL